MTAAEDSSQQGSSSLLFHSFTLSGVPPAERVATVPVRSQAWQSNTLELDWKVGERWAWCLIAVKEVRHRPTVVFDLGCLPAIMDSGRIGEERSHICAARDEF